MSSRLSPHPTKSDHEHSPPQSAVTSSTAHSVHIQDEKHEVHSVITPINPSEHSSINNNTNSDKNPLTIFHSAIGIPPPLPPKPKRNLLGRKKKSQPTDPEKATKPTLSSNNIGVYKTVVSNEKRAQFRYNFCNTVITIAMFLQIIVGASVTAFGAGSASHVVITVFGAANTALASLLAVLKSQGLPNRIRQDWNGWRELREYIEEKEREIEMHMSGKVVGRTIDVWEEIKVIEAMYAGVRLTGEANRPDSYTKVPPPAVIRK
ncbi:hypothetical protein F5884DRAFT_786243 [Xylogone sp. PMI_703]|nr:hypothetical protein F5884DRAFT_786243 [Xylogone sp. PMI_703]